MYNVSEAKIDRRESRQHKIKSLTAVLKQVGFKVNPRRLLLRARIARGVGPVGEKLCVVLCA